MGDCHYELLENLQGTIKEMFRHRGLLEKKLSYIDTCEQHILHYIELSSMDAVSGAKALKKLREVRIKRRGIKDEISAFQSALSRVTQANLHKYKVPNQEPMECEETLEKILAFNLEGES